MDAILGLLLLALYISGIVALAAGVTYAAIKIFPTKDRKKKDGDTPTPDESSSGGRLFRRSKREVAG
ncbi:MAG: hypothetical protein H0U46_00125 [Actinobacteria bacterium]|nr:hypothetical protein [Actinomycetota bacterium]